MSAGRTVAAARVIVAAWEYASPLTDLASVAAEALESACLLQDPELARELVALRARVAELEAAPTLIYRAEHPESGLTLGTYATEQTAMDHCLALAYREGATGLVAWVPDDGSKFSPMELTFFDLKHVDGDDASAQTCTGYIVTPLEIDASYDEEGDE
ncbi:hypothetical protein [Streptomyces sp. NPDC048442]|uniref:hypothetical protein n=1 Tax=Streptomyces sp. NPDC048442 TaxID=3154823 RepID=UPI0034478AFE